MNHTQRVIDHLQKHLSTLDRYYTWASSNRGHPTTDLLAGKIETWVQNLGPALGHMEEFAEYKRHVDKRRILRSPKGQGDVVIGGAGDAYAKVMQLKTIVSPQQSAVEKALGDAVNQIAGLTGEVANPDVNAVILIIILNSENPYPFSPTSRGGKTTQELANNLKIAINNSVQMVLNQTGPYQNNLNLLLSPRIGKTYALSQKSTIFKRSLFKQTSFYDPVRDRNVDQYEYLHTFTVKFRWPFGTPYLDQGQQRQISKIDLIWNPDAKDENKFQLSKCDVLRD